MMQKAQQSYGTREQHGRHVLAIHEGNHVPSWKTYGAGYADLEVAYHPAATWVSFRLEEGLKGAGRKITYLTLDEASGRALLAHLFKLYGEVRA